MPIVTITASHVGFVSHYIVCKEPFELGAEAREMPYNHIYHQDSCPVYHHEMPVDATRSHASNAATRRRK